MGLDLLASAQNHLIITPPGEGEKSFLLCYLGTADGTLHLARNATSNTTEGRSDLWCLLLQTRSSLYSGLSCMVVPEVSWYPLFLKKDGLVDECVKASIFRLQEKILIQLEKTVNVSRIINWAKS